VTAVLDASAVLALLYREPGHEQVTQVLAGAVISTVNWAEVIAKLDQRGHPDPTAAAEAVRALGVQVLAFTTTHAVTARPALVKNSRLRPVPRRPRLPGLGRRYT
jgi:ribonuclease VapC